jgi:microcystin-dependent protein
MSGEIKITPTVTLQDGTVLTAGVLRTLIEGLTAEILAGAITAREIADGAISADKLDASVSNQLGIPDAAVTVGKIADGALSADTTGRAKMADGFVTAAKIEAGTITATELVAGLAWPVGYIAEWAGESVPAGWLECNGAAVLRSTYAALFAVCGTLHGAGNGTTTFNIPDCRGMFVRGWNHGRATGGDPDAATRTGGDHVGSTQTDQLLAHVHTVKGQPQNPTTALNAYELLHVGGADTLTSASTGGTETRPANTARMYIVKY